MFVDVASAQYLASRKKREWTMKRIYYLAATSESANEVFTTVRDAGVGINQLNIIGENIAEIKKHKMKLANLSERRDIVRCLEIGALLGLLFGLISALVMVVIPPRGVEMTPSVFMLVAFVVCLFGLWVGGMIGLRKDNIKIAGFRENLDRGEFLVLIDLQEQQEEKIRSLMASNFSHIKVLREDPDATQVSIDEIGRAA